MRGFVVGTKFWWVRTKPPGLSQLPGLVHESVELVREIRPFFSSFSALRSLGASTSRHHWATVLFLMIGVGLMEGVGIVMLVPLLGFLGGGVNAPAWALALLKPLEWLGLAPGAGVLLSLFVAIVALRSLLQYGREQLGSALQHEVVDGLRKSCFDALLHVEWRWLCDKRQTDHANLLLTDVSRVGLGLHFGLGLLASAVTGLAWLVSAFWLSWQMTLLALLSGLVVLAAQSGQRRAAVGLGMSLGQANRALQGEVQEALQGIRLAKILGSESSHLARFVQTVRDVRQQQQAFMTGTQRARAWTQVGGAALLAGYLYLGLSYGQMPLAELLVLVMVFARLIPLLMNAQQQFHQCLHAWPALQETQHLLQECTAHAEPAATDTAPWVLTQGVSLDQVSVRYPQRQMPALNGVTLRLPAHTTTALIGTSGSGKSTLADVVMGLLLPDSGTVRIDGQALDATNRLRWRRSVAYVAQEVFLFHGTVRQNLLLACPQATEHDCRQALRMAAAEFVMDLPQGLDTLIGDGGVRLSGGERQRIALARALLGRPSLLILDEATSALDRDNELRIRQAIEAMHGKVTALIIGHRLPTLEHADQVIRLEDGVVVKQGTWAQVRGPQHGEETVDAQ